MKDMKDVKIITNFLKVASEMFPLTGNQHHNIILEDEKLTVMIMVNDMGMWWYCSPDNEEEWVNAEETLTILKKAIEDKEK